MRERSRQATQSTVMVVGVAEQRLHLSVRFSDIMFLRRHGIFFLTDSWTHPVPGCQPVEIFDENATSWAVSSVCERVAFSSTGNAIRRAERTPSLRKLAW